MKILVAEPLAPAGLELLKQQEGWTLIQSDPKHYAEHLADCDALLVRSAVKVTKDVLKKAPHLRVIGRAGVGVDNVDVNAATAAGVLVMNTPGGNAVSVAEHTLGLMLAMARFIPQANASTKAGKWEKKKFLGSELRGKTLGVVGLGSIGREVVKRARGFEMKILGSDPFVSPAAAQDLDVSLVSVEEIFEKSDYITLHVALTTETHGMINEASIATMKKGVRIVNCARGELVDPEAVRKGIESGKIAGVALDVFQVEPPAAGDALLALDPVLATPHIGGSTEEAQEIVGVRIVEQVIGYLKSGVALNAVNVPAMTAEQYRAISPYITLAEHLGTFASWAATGNPKVVRLVYHGKIADQNTALVRNAGIAGVLSRSMSHRANVVNALQYALDRGLSFAERHEPRVDHMDTIRLELETDQGTSSVEGAVVMDRPRVVQVDGIRCEARMEGHLLFLKTDDVPGVIGYIGGVLGKNGINISNFSFGRQDPAAVVSGPAQSISMIETDSPVPENLLKQLLENKAVKLARIVEFAD